MAQQPEISLVLPAYNEAGNIATVLSSSVQTLDRMGETWEILVVDNNSSDRTAEIVEQFSKGEPRVRFLRHDRNRLYSGSCATGLENGRGKFVAIMDSDGQVVAEDLPKFLARLRGGENIVFGWRKDRNDPLFRKIMSRIFNLLGKLWLDCTLHDLNCGFRMCDRKFLSLSKIRQSINMVNPELYVLAKRAQLNIGEVEVQHFERKQGTTSHNLFKFWEVFLKVNRYMRELHGDLSRPLLPFETPATTAENRRVVSGSRPRGNL